MEQRYILTNDHQDWLLLCHSCLPKTEVPELKTFAALPYAIDLLAATTTGILVS